ncbi:hypothetical protein [Kutzneria sp. CA-103260]|uniref:hypothetical protein n=1 Tax=Kutzneria sp. CA-103260 TaxID=2802641 RepID=UPI001BAB0435|nr:hypothetical protein [Kutzneria sp. CA-103260]QUQ69641.1 hypothetical protein JJ691_74010 [Kutzneria sp. CA-103260]
MRTWMRRGIPAALLAGGVLAMTAGNAAAAPAPIGDPSGIADTALRLADIVGHKGLPPLPDTSQIQLPTMPIGQSQRSLDPQDLAGGGLSLSNVQLNGQDLPKPQLPGLPALPGLGGGQRSLDPSHIAISDVPQLQQLPKLPSVASGLPVSVLPDMTTSRSLPNFTYSGAVPTGGLHELTQLPDLSSLPLVGGATGERDLPGLPALPKLPLPLPGASAERDLPGLSLLGSLPGLPAGRSLPGLGLLGNLPLAGLLGGAAGRELPGLGLLGSLPVGSVLGGAAGRELPGLGLLGTLPVGNLLGGVAGRDLPGLPALPSLPLLGGQERALPALPGLSMVQGLLAATPVAALLSSTPLGSVAGRSLPGIPALPLQLPGLPTGRSLPGLGSLPLAGLLGGGLPAMTDTDADSADTDAVDTDARSLPAVPALPKLPVQLPGLGGQQRELPVVDSVLPKLPLAVPAVPGASVSGFHGIPALGPSFTTTMPANDSARSIVPGVPSTAGVLGGLLGHAPRLPVSGI